MIWSHSNAWMLTADHGGFVKYWQSNMNNVKMYQAHKDPVRGLRWETSGDNRRHFALIYIWQYSCCTTIVAGRLVVACDNKVDNDAATTDSQWRIVPSSNMPALVVCAMALHLVNCFTRSLTS